MDTVKYVGVLHQSTSTPKAFIRSFLWVLVAFGAAVASLIMMLIVLFLVKESWQFIKEVGLGSFISDDGWWPLSDSFNLLPMLLSSLAVTLGALAIAVPLSIIFSVFCVFYGHPLVSDMLERFVDVCAAIPTVIYGFWGLVVLVPVINQITPPGVSLLAGMIVLAMMIFPTVVILTTASLRAIPFSHIQGATALGAKRSSTVLCIAIPGAKRGIIMAMILGTTRAIGETMVVLMVCGNVVQLPLSPFDSVRTLTANIALEMPYAMGDHRSSLFVTGLMVLIVVGLLVVLSEIYAHKTAKDYS